MIAYEQFYTFMPWGLTGYNDTILTTLALRDLLATFLTASSDVLCPLSRVLCKK